VGSAPTSTRTLVVTGAGGHIGRRLVAAALQENWAVRALVRRPESAKFPRSGYLDIAIGDIEQTATDPEFLRGADALCHLAAFIPPDHRDAQSAKECLRVNALGTLDLLEAAKEVGIPQFVYASTNAYEPGTGLKGESDALWPSLHSPYYLSSKLVGEYYCANARHPGFSVAALRIGSVYGPGMSGSGLIPTLAQRLKAGRMVDVHDGGRYTVDLVYIDDVVKAVMLAVVAGSNSVYNIGSGVLHTTLDVALTMADVARVSGELVRVEPTIADDEPRGFGGMDIERARAQLGYCPTSLRDGLRLYLRSLDEETD
jgi:UDP-glucose 4-epimerase